jgi:methyl-accepting chemotaxis protein
MDQMRSTLNQTLARVLMAAQSIATASAQVASGSNDLSQRTEHTAANLEESASAIEELSSSALHCADATRQAEQLARSSCDASQRGHAVAQQMQQTMEDIHRSSQKIGDIIGVIDGIAFQTNILALNAAVEAARAGEQGRGFAVVAGEVRALAQRSATAAKEIRSLIDSNLGSVKANSEQVHQASASMRDILDNVTRVQDIVSEVNAANREQSQGAAQVNQSIAQLDQMTQQNAALVEESSAAAAHLHAQSQDLQTTVQAFRLASTQAEHPSDPALLPSLSCLPH